MVTWCLTANCLTPCANEVLIGGKEVLIDLSSPAMSRFGDMESSGGDDDNLPFRKTQSMRATASRRIHIVDTLKQQRRLSNTSLDQYKGGCHRGCGKGCGLATPVWTSTRVGAIGGVAMWQGRPRWVP